MTVESPASPDKDALIALLLEQIARLEARIAELEARLKIPPKTPNNSSLPPSKGQRSTRPRNVTMLLADFAACGGGTP